MTIFWSDDQLKHRDTHFVQLGVVTPSRESAARASSIVDTLKERGKQLEAPQDFGMDPILAVHEADYLEFLKTAWRRWIAEFAGGTPIGTELNMLPNVFPHSSYAKKPDLIAGQMGWYMGDMAAEIVAGTWEATYASAQAAIQAARLTQVDGPTHYALCRPPGHHALSNRAMGFCYFNNSAIAANDLLKRFRKVAILDVDVHHGNGTQQIFYDRSDVFTVSMHSHPKNYYPYFTGYPEEVGEGVGEGFNLNLTYDFGSGDGPFLLALEQAIEAIIEYGADALVLGLGVDASDHDSHGRHNVTRPAFTTMAKQVSELGLPIVIIQEGGYESEILGHLIPDVLDVFGC